MVLPINKIPKMTSKGSRQIHIGDILNYSFQKKSKYKINFKMTLITHVVYKYTLITNITGNQRTDFLS